MFKRLRKLIMDSSRSSGRMKHYSFIYAVLMLCGCLLIGSTFSASGSWLPLFQSEEEKALVEDSKRTAKLTYGKLNIIQGDIVDRNGTAIMTSASSDGPAVYRDPLAYTQAIGFTNKLGDYLLAGNQVNKTWLYDAEDDTDKGCTIRTTLDCGLQEDSYRWLKANCVGEGGTEGNIVIMDAKTGALLAFAAYPSFSVDDLTAEITALREEDETRKNAASWLDDANFLEYPLYPLRNPRMPGSVFKIVTSIALAEMGSAALETPVNDRYGYLDVDGVKLKNADGVYGEITFRDAFIHSVNVYFASKAINEIGKTRLDTVAERCGMGEEQYFDFGTMLSRYAFENDNRELARTAIGQQNVQMSALQIASITQAIAADGSMAKPHMVLDVTRTVKTKDKEGKTVYAPGDVVAQEAVDPQYKNICTRDVAAVIKDAMTATGEYQASSWGAHLIVNGEEKGIACKTGTGEIDLPQGGYSGYNNLWITSYAPADDPQYVVVLNRYDADGFGSQMYTDLVNIYEKLLTQQTGAEE